MLRPPMAVENTLARATDMNDEVAKGRSLTYWDREKSVPRGPRLFRTSPTGSMSTRNDMEQRPSVASGYRTWAVPKGRSEEWQRSGFLCRR